MGNWEPSCSPTHPVRVIEVDTARPLAGMACDSGTEDIASVSISDDLGIVPVHEHEGLHCWSSRGPMIPAPMHGDIVIADLVRPGTARAGFVIGPSSTRLVVATIDSGGAASDAGLRVGDAIVDVDGANVTSLWPQELMYLVWTHPRGALRLAVDRDGSRRDISIPIRE
jgi:predicted metalloprotease with PDZ domain